MIHRERVVRSLVAWVLIGLAAAVADDAALERSFEAFKKVDPDADCKIAIADGVVTIETPGTLHDLSAVNHQWNAPRLLRAIEGDFTVIVRVAGAMNPGGALENCRTPPYHGAGILVWAAQDNYLRFERNAFMNGNSRESVSPLLEYWKQNENLTPRPGTPHPFFMLDATYLRLSRKGDRIRTSMSHDGREWVAGPGVTVDMPAKVSVGLAAVNSSDRPLSAKFSDIRFASRASKEDVELAERAKQIAGWGTAIDPREDCDISLKDGKLVIQVPGKMHDLSFYNPRREAPRVLQPIEGDFTVQVKVTGTFNPGAPLEGSATPGFNGAGLLVWDGEKNYLRFERNALLREDGTTGALTPLIEYWKDGNNTTPSPVGERDYFKRRTTWLRMVRQGATFWMLLSQDGKEWLDGGTIDCEFPNKVELGVAAVNTSDKAFTVEFSEWKLLRETAQAEAPAAETK